MRHTPHRFVSFASLCILATAACVMSGCPKENSKTTDEDQLRAELAQEIAHTAEYTVRGRVVSLPNADNDLIVYHEAIPEYRGPEGMGMDVMPMPFPLGDGISLADIEPDDKVKLTFSVDYKEGWSPIAFRVIAIEELPADTELDFTPLPGDGESPE